MWQLAADNTLATVLFAYEYPKKALYAVFSHIIPASSVSRNENPFAWTHVPVNGRSERGMYGDLGIPQDKACLCASIIGMCENEWEQHA